VRERLSRPERREIRRVARVRGPAARDDGGVPTKLAPDFARDGPPRPASCRCRNCEKRCYAARAVERVLVLNASYEPLNVCSLRRAHVLVWKGKAEILESNDRPLRSACTQFRRPHVIRLMTYVRVPRGVTRRISRRVLFARDGWQCVYCGSAGNRLTLDHVVPRSRGGTSVWENVVTSCAPCNHRKGDRLLEETSMILRTTPRPPKPVLFIRLAADHVPEVWRRYVPGLETAAAAA